MAASGKHRVGEERRRVNSENQGRSFFPGSRSIQAKLPVLRILIGRERHKGHSRVKELDKTSRKVARGLVLNYKVAREGQERRG